MSVDFKYLLPLAYIMISVFHGKVPTTNFKWGIYVPKKNLNYLDLFSNLLFH